MTGKFLAGSAAMIAACFALATGSALAEDRPLIWQQSKNSDTSYSVKLGLKLPSELQPEAGFDMGVDTSKDGAVLNTPLKFWSSLRAESIQRPAYEMNRDVGFDIDHNAGSAAITMNYYEKHIATPTIDIERQSSYAVRYDATSQQWAGIDVSQSVRISKTTTGTAFVVRAGGSDSFKVAGAGIGVEQRLGDHITVSGSVDHSSDSAGAVASINASYAYKW